MTLPNFDGEDPIKDAFARAYEQLSADGIGPNSVAGKKFLAEALSSAGQLFEGMPPLPGTEQVSGNALFALRMALGIKLPDEKK